MEIQQTLDRLQAYLAAKRGNAQRVATHAALHRISVARIASGQIKEPSAYTIKRIALALDEIAQADAIQEAARK